MFHPVRLVPNLVACSKRERGYAPGASCGARSNSAPTPRAPVSPLPPEVDTVQETGVRALTSPPSRSAALSVSRDRPRLPQSVLCVRRGSSRAKLSGSRVDEECLGAILKFTGRVTFLSCDGLGQSFSLGASLVQQLTPLATRMSLKRCVPACAFLLRKYVLSCTYTTGKNVRGRAYAFQQDVRRKHDRLTPWRSLPRRAWDNPGSGFRQTS